MPAVAEVDVRRFGAMEALVCIESIQQSRVYPTVNPTTQIRTATSIAYRK